NYQGCGHPRFRNFWNKYRKEFHSSLVALFKTRISGSKVDSTITKLRFNNSFRVEATGFARGIWVLWDDKTEVDVLRVHPQFVHVRIWDTQGQMPFLCTAVYGKPQKSMREYLWEELEIVAINVVEPWLMAGDFNAILWYNERQGGVESRNVGCSRFNSFVFRLSLNYLGFQGPMFTWNRDNLFHRLDRSLCNDRWQTIVPNTFVQHLHRLKLDHRPFLETVNPTSGRRGGRGPLDFLLAG
ncbi:hypothetical protein ES288_D07G190900v1, partial [Gossypium darwinii]